MESTKCRGIWTQEALDKAIEAVSTKTMSNYKASQQFGIPRRTLRRYIDSNTTGKAKLGRKSALTSEQNADLCSRIVKLAEIGYPITSTGLRLCIYKYCVKNNISHQFSDIKQIASHKWVRRFLKANPIIALWKSQSFNLARFQKLNKFIVEKHFKSLRALLERHNLFENPERIFNVAGKSCRLNLQKEPTVLAQKGISRVHIMGNEHSENMVVILCINAVGSTIPPMILFKDKQIKPEFTDALPPGSACCVTEQGSMTSNTLVNWIYHFAKYKPAGLCLAILDGAKYHLDFDILEAAEQHDILLYCLPSVTTYEFQPLDQGWSFEYHWDEELQLQINKGENTVIKQRFGKIFSKVWDKCMTPSYIKSSFKACGIFPLDPNVIPETAFASRTVAEMLAPENLLAVSTPVSPHTTTEIVTKKHHSSLEPGPSNYTTNVIVRPDIHFWSDDEEDLIKTLFLNETHSTEDMQNDAEHVTSFRKVISSPRKKLKGQSDCRL